MYDGIETAILQQLLSRKSKIFFEGEREMNMAGTAKRDSVSIVLGWPKKFTEDVSRRNYKWKLQTSTRKYDS